METTRDVRHPKAFVHLDDATLERVADVMIGPAYRHLMRVYTGEEPV